MKWNKIAIIVGVGGTGGNLAPMTAKFLPEDWKIVLVDGDRVTKSNLTRQPYQAFDVGLHKADSLARKITTATGRYVDSVNNYLGTPEQLNKIVGKEIDNSEIILLGMVDNHPARMIMEKWFKSLKTDTKLYIDSANELSSGQIIASTNGKMLRSDRFPEIKNDTKDNPLDISCEITISEGVTQQYSTNMMAATTSLQLIDDWFKYRKDILIDLEEQIKENKRYLEDLVYDRSLEEDPESLDDLNNDIYDTSADLKELESTYQVLSDARNNNSYDLDNNMVFFDTARFGMKII